MHNSTLFVLDSRVFHGGLLRAAVKPEITTITLDFNQDGLRQISQALGEQSSINSLHILCHGSPGCLHLGNGHLGLDNLAHRSEELREWFAGVECPQIFLYGCNVAAGDAGTEFVEKLAGLTGAGVSASTTAIGHQALGGDWYLDFQTGDIIMENIFSASELAAYPGVLDGNGKWSLFDLVDFSGIYTERLDALQLLVQEQLSSFFAQSDYLTQLAIPFSATAGDGWMGNAESLRSTILDGNYQIRLEVRSGAELQGALGAYSAAGTTGTPTIYLNSDWFATANQEQIVAVLLEEIGHDFDQILNNGADSRGDEGEIFSNLVLGNEFDLGGLQQEGDRKVLTIDGRSVVVETALPAVGSIGLAANTWQNLKAGNDPNKASDGSWTANSADLVGSAAEPYIQIKYDADEVAFKIRAEPQSGSFKALIGVFIDIDGDGSPDFTVELNVDNSNQAPSGYTVGAFNFIPITVGTGPTANTSPSTTVIPAANTNTYFALNTSNVVAGVFGSGAAAGIPVDVDNDSTNENYYVFKFSLADLNTFINGLSTAYKKPTILNPSQWNAAALTASNSLNSINGDVGGGAFTQNTLWTDIFGINSGPVLSIPSTLNYTENQTGTAINTSITVADSNNTTLSSATVSITSNFQSGQDTLAFTNNNSTTFGNISAIYDSSTGVLTLTSAGSTATLAQWQSALRAVTYSNNSEAPSTSARTISYQINDGQNNNNLSNIITSTVNVTAVNDAPVNTLPATFSVNEDTNLTLTGLSISDVDAGTGDVTVTLSVNSGTLSASSSGNVTVNNSGTSSIVLTGTVANINTFLTGFAPVFAPSANFNGAVTLTMVTNDGGNTGGAALSDTDTSTITVNSVNDA
ncbi:DUF4347 domain-containing protein, partial [Synechocystis sp. CS-94]